MRLGLFMMPVHPPGRTMSDTLREDTAKSLLADQLGFDELWMGEHFSAITEPFPSPLMFLAGLVPQTKNLTFGTAVINLPNHHPAIVAGEVAQFDHMSGGRFILGIGPGGLASDHELFEVGDGAKRGRMFVEAIDHMIKIYGRRTRHTTSKANSGTSGSRRRSCPSSASAPCQSRCSSHIRRSTFPSAAPIRRRPAWRRRAAGASSRVPTRRPIRSPRTGRPMPKPAPRQASRRAATIGGCRATSSWRRPTRRPGARVRRPHREPVFLHVSAHRGRQGRPAQHHQAAARHERRGVHAGRADGRIAIYGSPKTVLDKLIAFRDPVGPFGAVLKMGVDWGGPSEAWEREAMRLLAQEVMPKFRQHITAQAAE